MNGTPRRERVELRRQEQTVSLGCRQEHRSAAAALDQQEHARVSTQRHSSECRRAEKNDAESYPRQSSSSEKTSIRHLADAAAKSSTRRAIKTCHVIVEYNCRISWWIFALSVSYQVKQE